MVIYPAQLTALSTRVYLMTLFSTCYCLWCCIALGFQTELQGFCLIFVSDLSSVRNHYSKILKQSYYQFSLAWSQPNHSIIIRAWQSTTHRKTLYMYKRLISNSNTSSWSRTLFKIIIIAYLDKLLKDNHQIHISLLFLCSDISILFKGAGNSSKQKMQIIHQWGHNSLTWKGCRWAKNRSGTMRLVY